MEQKDEVKDDQKEEAKQGDKGAEYDQEWARLEEEETGEKPQQNQEKEEESVEDDKEEHPVDDDKKEEAAPVKDAKKEEVKDKDLTGIEKALHDTKSYATKLAQENANLKKALNEKDSSDKAKKVEEAKVAQKEAQDRLNGSLQEAYKEYPELKEALDGLKSELMTTRKEIDGLKSEKSKQESEQAKLKEDAAYFEQNIKPEIVKVHSDFDAIVKDPQAVFFKWAEKQTLAIRVAVFNSMDPADMNMAIDAYKRDKSSGYIKETKDKDAKDRDLKLKNAQSLRGGQQIPDNLNVESGPKGKENYEGGWDEAGKLLEKEGVS
jgi:hypothetical protein